MLVAMVRQDIEKGLTKGWGTFLAEFNGYSINEGAEIEVMNSLQQCVPFCTFNVFPVATEDRVNEMLERMMG